MDDFLDQVERFFINWLGKANVLMVERKVWPKVVSVGLVLIIAFIVARITKVFLDKWKRNLLKRRDGDKNPAALAGLVTKITIIRKILDMGIYFFALVFILLQFKEVRHIGTSLLASAGVLGVVLGVAAKGCFSNVIAGIWLSFSQPIRLEDAVVLDKEFGWVEEITLTHTTIRAWDNRRIIVPNTVLVERVVENWTIRDASLVGTVMLYADYSCDVEKVRQWVKEIVDKSPDSTSERVAVVQVTDFTEKSMQIRVLCKGANSNSTWNLRCELREKLIKKFKEASLPLPCIRLNEPVKAKKKAEVK